MKKLALILVPVLFFLSACKKEIVVNPIVKTCAKDSIKIDSAKMCPSLVMDGVTYTLSVCEISDTLILAEGGNIAFQFTIIPSDLNASYSFEIRSRSEAIGFPAFSVSGGMGGGAQSFTNVMLQFEDTFLRPGTYDGYLPIHLYPISSQGDDENRYLKLKLHLVVI